MRPMKLLAAWGIAMVLSGAPFDYSCPARSVHPLYTEGETVFVPELVGTWAKKDEDQAWILRKSDAEAYHLSVQDDEGKVSDWKLDAHLVRLGEFLFLDIYADGTDEYDSPDPVLMFPAHTIYKIDLNGDVLGAAPLRDKWLAWMIDKQKLDIAHERTADNILLTASTAELQSLLLKYGDHAEAFDDGIYHRQK
jgi:hypothetical protein